MRLLTDADVARFAPDPLAMVDLARDALVALADGTVRLPPKPTVRAAPEGSFANAMPAAWPERDLLGCKWVTLFPGNPALGLPTAQGVVVVSDGRDGSTRAVLPAARLTALRTAAVSGACVRALDPGTGHVAITGAGVQARSHLTVLAALGVRDVVVYARRAEAREALADWASREVPAVALRTVDSAEAAVRGAGVVVTALSIGLTGTTLDPDLLRPDVLLLPLDYASSVDGRVAATGLLAADDVDQFRALRADRKLGDHPEPQAWTGALLGGPRPDGRVTCQNLGSGLVDLVVAAATVEAAEAAGAGVPTGP